MDQPLKLLCDQVMEWWYRNGGRPAPSFVTLALKLIQEDAADTRPMGVQQAEADRPAVNITDGMEASNYVDMLRAGGARCVPCGGQGCAECGNQGWTDADKGEPCPRCDGAGTRRNRGHRVNCGRCRGTGRLFGITDPAQSDALSVGILKDLAEQEGGAARPDPGDSDAQPSDFVEKEFH